MYRVSYFDQVAWTEHSRFVIAESEEQIKDAVPEYCTSVLIQEINAVQLPYVLDTFDNDF